MVPMLAHADTYFDAAFYGTSFYISNDITIAAGGIVDVYDVFITKSANLQNHGQMSGDIHICNGCHVNIQNSGEINDTLLIDNNATMTQIITSGADVTRLDVVGNYSILVDNASGIAISDIMHIAAGADKIILSDSNLDFITNRKPKLKTASTDPIPAIELVGNNRLNINSADISDGMVLLYNVHGEGTISLNVSGLTKMQAANVSVANGNAHVYLARETDYYKILNTDTGHFLNRLRLQNPSDKLIVALDKATDFPTLYKIMSKSVRLNPGQIRKPLKLFNQHTRTPLDMFARTDYATGNVFAEPFAIISSEMSTYGAHIGLNITASPHISIRAGGYCGTVKYTDSIDDMIGILYGGDVKIKYEADDMFVGIDASTTFIRLDSPDTYYHGHTSSQLDAMSGYINLSAGPNIKIYDGLRMIPYVSTILEIYNTPGDTTANPYINAGTIITYAYTGVDVIYDYGLNISSNTTKGIFAALSISAASATDMIGANILFGINHDDYATSYQIKTGVKFNF